MVEGVGRGEGQPGTPLRFGRASALLALAGLGGMVFAGGFKHVPWLATFAGIGFYLLELAALSTALIGAVRVAGRTHPEGDRALLILGGGLSLVLVVLAVRPILPRRPTPRVEGVLQAICGANLENLGVAMEAYCRAHEGMYPTPEKWCDLLTAETNDLPARVFRCPRGQEGRCHYAVNPLADPRGAPDVVLLFESDHGWNASGGPEILTVKRHDGKGCNVLFVDGSIEFVKADEIVGLKWMDATKLPEELRNARRPANDAGLNYWLENMVWYHGFTTEEMRLATGLTEREILAAQKKFRIWPERRPRWGGDARLVVLPYPGGRHPRIGFLEGAIDPQRETKFSVFTPWDLNSYVVVDVPEAIWSNLGLTYLAHTHIDTIWTKQGIELPKLEWNRRPDGSLNVRRTLPNGIIFGVKAVPTTEAVRMEMWLENGSPQKLSDLRVQNCVMSKMAAGFAGQTNENKVFTNPYVACRSEDGKRWIITAWEGCNRPWGNENCPCFHSDPKFPDLEPGQRHVLRGWLSFFEGEDIQAEFARIEATGWRRD